MIPSPSEPGGPIRFITRLLVAAYLIEAGLLLVIAPWTRLWEHNAFVRALPVMVPVFSSLFFRGAVSGVGLLTAVGGLRDLLSIFMARSSHDLAVPPVDGHVE